MEVIYLKKMQQNPGTGSFKNVGVRIEKISDLEERLSINFPQAYKEFLVLGGEFTNLLSSWEYDFENLENVQEYVKNNVLKVGLNLQPFWCFAEYDDAESCLFFFFKDGDDPAIYNFISQKVIVDSVTGDEVFYEKTYSSFSEMIDVKLRA